MRTLSKLFLILFLGIFSSNYANSILVDNYPYHPNLQDDPEDPIDTCEIAILPFTEDFNEASAIPDCFTPMTNYLEPIQIRLSTTSPNLSKTVCLMVNNSTYSIFALPKISDEIDISQLRISFSSLCGELSGIAEIGILTDITEATTFERVAILNYQDRYVWYDKSIDFTNYDGEGKYIAFKFSNAGSSSSSTHRLFIDNIYLDLIPECSQVRNLRTTMVGATTASFAWEADYHENDWFEVEYLSYSDGTVYTDQSDTTIITVTNLSEASLSTFRVRTMCAGFPTDWTEISFQTECHTPDLVFNIDSGRIADMSSRFFPFCPMFLNSYSQQIFLASELEESMDINSIAFEYIHTSNISRDLIIYIGQTARNSCIYSQGWYPLDSMTKVFEDAVQFSTSTNGGWVTIPIETFQYVDTSNLIIAVFDNTPTHIPGSDCYFRTHRTSQNMAFKKALVNNTGTIDNPGTQQVQSYRNNIRFYTCRSVACYAPQLFSASEILGTDVSLTWNEVTTGANYEIQYKTTAGGDNDWISVYPVIGSSHDLYDLAPNASYEARIRTICTDDTTQWKLTTFATSCALQGLPYTENFDAPNFPDCWIRYSEMTGRMPGIAQGQGVVGGALSFGQTSTGYNIVVLPELDHDLNLQDFQISFKTKSTSINNAVLTIGLLTNRSTNDSYTVIDTIRFNHIGEWIEHLYLFEDFQETSYSLAFKCENLPTDCNIYLDLLNIEYKSSCFSPSNVRVDSVSHEDALIYFDQRGYPSVWIFEYGAPGFIPGTGTPYLSANSEQPVLIPNLDPATSYDLYIRAICEVGDTSDYSTVISFRTDQSTAQLPYSHNFENETENEQWALINGTQVNKWYITDLEGGKALFISQDNGITNSYNDTERSSVWAYRDVTLPAETTGEFVIDIDWRAYGYTNSWGTHFDYLSVYVGSCNEVSAGSQQNPDSSSVLFDVLNGQQIFEQANAVIPSSYAGQTVRVYFLWRNFGGSANQPPAAIRNVDIFHTECAMPTNIILDTLSVNMAAIQWDANGAAEWLIEYRHTDSLNWNIDTVSLNTYTFHNLRLLTEYKVRLRAICGDQASRFINFEFTTPGYCNAPAQIITTEITTNSFNVSWPVVGEKWQLRIHDNAAMEDILDTVLTTASYSARNLLPETQYTLHLNTICDWSISDTISASVTTESVVIPTYRITVTVGENGSVTPDGVVEVPEGSDTSFLITANTDYVIDAIFVDGEIQPVSDTVWFRNVTADHTLSVEFATGINHYEITNSISLSPNPAQGYVNINLEKDFTSYIIYNTMGQQITSENITEKSFTIRLDHLSAGTYLIAFISEQGVATKKLIKQ